MCRAVYLALLLLLGSAPLLAQTQSPVLLLVHGTDKAGDIRTLSPHTIASSTNQVLLKALGPYSIEFQAASMTRIDRILNTQANSCAINRVKTPARERNSLFSKPINMYLGLKLFFLSEQLPLMSKTLNQQGQLISLNQLFDVMPEKVIGVDKDRAHGSVLDSQLATIKRKNFTAFGGTIDFLHMMELLAQHRVDFILGYPSELHGVLKQYGKPLEISSLSIAGVAPYTVGFIECAQSATGRRFIDDINRALDKLHPSAEFKQAHTRYLSEQDLLLFERYFQQVFNL